MGDFDQDEQQDALDPAFEHDAEPALGDGGGAAENAAAGGGASGDAASLFLGQYGAGTSSAPDLKLTEPNPSLSDAAKSNPRFDVDLNLQPPSLDSGGGGAASPTDLKREVTSDPNNPATQTPVPPAPKDNSLLGKAKDAYQKGQNDSEQKAGRDDQQNLRGTSPSQKRNQDEMQPPGTRAPNAPGIDF